LAKIFEAGGNPMRKTVVSSFFTIITLLNGCTGVHIKNQRIDPVFLKVIESPAAFDGQKVKINAWITLRHEDKNLWASWQAHENWDTQKCISLIGYDALEKAQNRLDGRYVEITGVIRSDASQKGSIIRLASCRDIALEIVDEASLRVMP
jgi:hypothetical protein